MTLFYKIDPCGCMRGKSGLCSDFNLAFCFDVDKHTQISSTCYSYVVKNFPKYLLRYNAHRIMHFSILV